MLDSTPACVLQYFKSEYPSEKRVTKAELVTERNCRRLKAVQDVSFRESAFSRY